MKRPFGVIFSAILLILGSFFQLLMALVMALAGAISHKQIHSGGLPSSTAATPAPYWMPVFMYAICVFFVALAVWGILTAVGLIRMRRWARYSVLVIGGLVAFFGMVILLVTLLMMIVPLPAPPNVDASQSQTAQAITRIGFGGIAFLHGIVCAVGVSWLVYFNRQKVRDVFASESGITSESRRPILISVIAVLSMIGAVSCLLMVFGHMPGAFFGWILYGWQKAAYYIVFAALEVAVGIGLWQMKVWGWRLALCVKSFGLIHSSILLVFPSLMSHYHDVVHKMVNPTRPQLSEQHHLLIHNAMFGLSVVFIMAILAVLIYYRKAFHSSEELSQNGSALP